MNNNVILTKENPILVFNITMATLHVIVTHIWVYILNFFLL